METIKVNGELLFELSSKADWVARVPRILPDKIRPGEKLIWVDKNGNVFEAGRDFMAAEKMDSYPCKVYRPVCVDQALKENIQIKPSDDILDTLHRHREFCFKTFPTATALSSLEKAKTEIEEIELDITFETIKAEEYADAIFCLMDSANRAGLSPEIVFQAMTNKLAINMTREWIDNGDGTYSHKEGT